MKTFHIVTLIFLKMSGTVAALQHLQTNHPDAAYVRRLPLQEITQMNKKNILITLKAICTIHLMTMALGQASIFFNSTVIHKETLIQNTWAFVVM
jgi:hypothetical protein